MKINIAHKLKTFRLEKKLSQKEFAQILCMPYRSYQEIELGNSPRITFESLLILRDMGLDVFSDQPTDQMTSAPAQNSERNMAGVEDDEIAPRDFWVLVNEMAQEETDYCLEVMMEEIKNNCPFMWNLLKKRRRAASSATPASSAAGGE